MPLKYGTLRCFHGMKFLQLLCKISSKNTLRMTRFNPFLAQTVLRDYAVHAPHCIWSFLYSHNNKLYFSSIFPLNSSYKMKSIRKMPPLQDYFTFLSSWVTSAIRKSLDKVVFISILIYDTHRVL